ncbi:electron transport complex subunit RsxC [Planctobacterium marinum]|uniref:electron transport complex subunit RsxC n=1 Tax=Planctobacterium marinum TaxID=1631968 RepID=UPI001E3D408A|nr:electron transport complex subunit RsxC [Planctobacterium marinum]MCC2605946.1 electron transport complex subunit RsxC [Planctobacterium marinum]
MFNEILERIKKGQFWQFPGGVIPPGKKALSNNVEIERLPLADKLYIPVKQHVGVSGRISVEKGHRVLKGQPLTQSMNPLSVPIHAPTSGTIEDIRQHVSNHPSGIPEQTLILVPDGKEEWVDLKPVSDYQSLPRATLVEEICSAGIAGMGGAGFPAHIKLSSGRNIEFLIINGVECEPYITSDDRLMREHAWQIRQGIDVLSHILKPRHVLIAIEDNKPEAFAAMEIAFQDNPAYSLCAVETKYPAGGEKQLIQVLTGKEVPSKGLPVDIGIIMHNVGTCYAIADAIFSGKPLLERVVTVTGEALTTPQNVWLPLGTPVAHAIAQCGYLAGQQKAKRVIMGGPMMGYTLHSDLVPIVKTSNCILVPSDKEMPFPGDEHPCIRCGACADACPAGLLPQQLYWHAKAKEYDKAQALNLFDCIECGACAFVCPSNIPLVHYYRGAKADIRIQQDEAIKAAKAKERFEARNARLEKEKLEREEKARQSAAARAKRQEQAVQTKDKPAVPAANDRVAAALARAKAKKAQQAEHDSDATRQVETATTEPVKDTTPGDSNSTEQQSRVATAIARAKAKKAQQAESTSALSDEPATQEGDKAADDDPQKARVAAAIARAKAKKAQQTEGTSTLSDKPATQEGDKPAGDDPQKARVAAAIARAKAKKAQQAENAPAAPEFELENSSHNEPDAQAMPEASANAPESSDDKQDRVAAAIARAKAKRAAREQQSKNNEQDD